MRQVERKPRVSRTPITVYTDGACQPNPGRGGCAAILIAGDTEMTVQGGYQLTTNNRMEILAVILAMEALPVPCAITVYSDSKYVVDTIDKNRFFYWATNGWIKADGEPAKNSDLWQRLKDAYWVTNNAGLREPHSLKMHWIKGHADDDGVHTAYNHKADAAAVDAIEKVGAFRVDPQFAPAEEAPFLT